MTDTVLQWSGGKDSALALYRLEQQSRRTVVELQTMFNEAHGRTSWHGIRQEVMAAQADVLGLPLRFVPVDDDMDAYTDRMSGVFAQYRDRGVEYLAVGDIDAEDPGMPREQAMEAAGLHPFYPLLGEPTAELVREFVDAGFRATIVVVNGDVLDRSFVGRELTDAFLDDLPDDADIGGERGEYHTFVHDGPTFDAGLDVETIDIVTRRIAGEPYHYGDLRLA